MQISAKLSVIMAAVFAVLCFAVAINGFTSASGVDDPVLRADSLGFAGFWAFLGTVAVVFGAVGVWLLRTQKESDHP